MIIESMMTGLLDPSMESSPSILLEHLFVNIG
jgi:hypothetical protein